MEDLIKKGRFIFFLLGLLLLLLIIINNYYYFDHLPPQAPGSERRDGINNNNSLSPNNLQRSLRELVLLGGVGHTSPSPPLHGAPGPQALPRGHRWVWGSPRCWGGHTQCWPPPACTTLVTSFVPPAPHPTPWRVGGEGTKTTPLGGGGAHTHIMTTRTRLCRPQHARDTSEWRRGSSLSRGGGFAPGTIPLASGLMPTSPLPRPRGLPGQRERGTTGMEKDEMPPSCPIPGAPSQKKPRERGRDGHGGAHPPPQPRDLKLPELNEGLCHP